MIDYSVTISPCPRRTTSTPQLLSGLGSVRAVIFRRPRGYFVSTTSADDYRTRFRKVLEHIDGNLNADLSVERLSGVAAFSKYHFHRQFSELYGIGVYKYVQLCRLKRAAYQLAFRNWSPIIDIALANGYDGPESFARAFRKSIGQSPSAFRKQPQWKPWYAIY